MKKLFIISSLLFSASYNFAEDMHPLAPLLMMMAMRETALNLPLEEFPSDEAVVKTLSLLEKMENEPEFSNAYKPNEHPEDVKSLMQWVFALATCSENPTKENHQRCTELVTLSKGVIKDQEFQQRLDALEKKLQEFKAETAKEVEKSEEAQ